MVTSLFSIFSYRVAELVRGDERRTFVVVFVLSTLSIVTVANAPDATILTIGYGGLAVSQGLLAPFLSHAVNRRIPSERRAAILSIIGMSFQLTGFFFGPFFGHLADTTSVVQSARAFQWLMLALVAAVSVFVWRVFRPTGDGSDAATGVSRRPAR